MAIQFPVLIGTVGEEDGLIGTETIFSIVESRLLRALQEARDGGDPESILLGLVAIAKSLDDVDDEEDD